MQTRLGHILLNIQPTNAPFYKDLMQFLGWQVLHEGDGMLGVGDANGTSVWFMGPANEAANDYDGAGMNHLAISAPSQADVDAAVSYLQERKVAALFETPRHRPEFGMAPDQTYYQVMFETPDRILMEVVYTGPKSA